MPRHDIDAVSLVAGLLVMALGALGLPGATGSRDATRWILPLLLVAAGSAGIALTLVRRPR